jgi:AcrR family transcriptional regulator
MRRGCRTYAVGALRAAEPSRVLVRDHERVARIGDLHVKYLQGVDLYGVSVRRKLTYDVSLVKRRSRTYDVSLAMERRDPGATRTPLSRERVLRAAVALADEGGIEALSMRRLARELGVEAMSLYNHVANKDAILDGIVDAVVGEIELPSNGVDWRSAMRRNVISTRDVLVRHPWASKLWMARQTGGPAQLRNADWRLRVLREAGFSNDVIYHAFHILEAYVLGYTGMQLSFPYKGEELAGMATTFLQQLPADEYPDLVDHIMQHLQPHEEGEGGFELGLDLILDGLQARGASPAR